MYANAKKDQAVIAEKVAVLIGAKDIVPKYMLQKEAGAGYKFSLLVVIASAIASIAFCLSLVNG